MRCTSVETVITTGARLRQSHAGSRWLQCKVYGEVLIDLHTRIDAPHHWGIAAIEFMDKMGAEDAVDEHHAPRMRVVHSKYKFV